MSSEAVNESQRSLPREWMRFVPAAMMASSRCAAVAIQFLCQLIIANLAGAAGLGLFQLFSSWTCILGEILAQGLPARMMRVISVGFDRGDYSYCREQMRVASKRIRYPALWILAISILAMMLLQATDWSTSELPLAWLIFAVVVSASLFALLRIYVEALKGTDAPLAAISIESLGPPILVLMVCLACLSAGITLSSWLLLIAGTTGFGLSLAVTGALLRKRLSITRAGNSHKTQVDEDQREQRALWANSVLAIVFVQLPFILLPWFADVAQIGVFSVAHKLVNLVTLLLILMAAVFGPAFARAGEQRNVSALRELLRRTQYLSMGIFLPLAAMLVVLQGPLTTMFNFPPEALQPFLYALLLGQLVNAATGLPGLLMNMTGAAQLELKVLLMSLAFAALLGGPVGYLYGAVGIAWLVSATLALKNFASLYFARCHLVQLGEIQ
ncbi:hypothetical protein A3709_09015 [Halioglobus sp. HI00S01]|uniref:lipopolysaccharide biosynthesis protein n=1 Tax=Halioglobus sp. HI00S01 TaxID=1822214 RepID=UPI0007C2F7D8|nr:lipopolysaccharide biosynthesis protein [Halioglobus sp. HI00S01]KZX55118.1 hypothetical protein A3709_09015 [Halioglobus sp. HI00S01]